MTQKPEDDADDVFFEFIPLAIGSFFKIDFYIWFEIEESKTR